MTAVLLASVWWFLYRTNDYKDPPRAAGPYPAAEACRLAGRAMFSTDQRFMTAAEKAADEVQIARERASAAARHQHLIDEAIVAKKRGRVTLSDWSVVEIGPDGRSRDLAISTGTVLQLVDGTPDRAISACLTEPAR